MKKENNENFLQKILLYLVVNTENSKSNKSCFGNRTESCTTVLLEYKTNLKSIKIFKNNTEVFESIITQDAKIYYNCQGGYKVPFQNNNYISSFEVYSLNGNYCGLKLEKRDGSNLQYEMSFNGDLNTFTEITAGEYRFTSVR